MVVPTTSLPLDWQVTISTRGKPSILSIPTLRYRLSSLMWIRMLQKFLASWQWHAAPSWSMPLIMAAPPPSRACSFRLLRLLRTMPLTRFPTLNPMLHQHPVTQPGSALTPLHDITLLYLISRISTTTPFLPICLTAALVQDPLRTLMSMPLSRFSTPGSRLLP